MGKGMVKRAQQATMRVLPATTWSHYVTLSSLPYSASLPSFPASQIQLLQVGLKVIEDLLLLLPLLLPGHLLLLFDELGVESLVENIGSLLLVVSHFGHGLYHLRLSQGIVLVEVALYFDFLVYFRELLALHFADHFVVPPQLTTGSVHVLHETD